MPQYNPARDVTPAFVERVAGWITNTGEVLVVLRYLCAAGWKDFALCRSRAEFETIIGLVPDGTDIVVLRDPQLPLRGAVTPQFIALALDAIPDGAEYLGVSLETGAGGGFQSWIPIGPGTGVSSRTTTGDSHVDLRETLQSWLGEEIALGAYPDIWASDHEGLVSAAKGGIDGAR